MRLYRKICAVILSIGVGICSEPSAIATPSSLSTETVENNGANPQSREFFPPTTEDNLTPTPPDIKDDGTVLTLPGVGTPEYISDAVERAAYTAAPISFGDVGGLTQEEVE